MVLTRTKQKVGPSGPSSYLYGKSKIKVMRYDVSVIKIVKSYIGAHRGWAVAEQFEDSYNGEPFEEQNGNALLMIRDIVRTLANSDVFAEKAVDDLKDYLDELERYLAKRPE